MVSPPLSSTGAGALARLVFAQSEETQLGKTLPFLFSKCLSLTLLFIFAVIFHIAPYYPSGHMWMLLFLVIFVRIILVLPLPACSTAPCLFCTLHSELFLKSALWERDYLPLYRIIESFRLEKTFNIIKSNHHPCPLNHVMEYPVYALFEYLQGWWLKHFPGQPVPMPDNPLSKKIFPNI